MSYLEFAQMEDVLKTLRMEPSIDTPGLYFDALAGTLEITGKSFPADVTVFFSPAVKWIDNYVNHPVKHTVITLKLDYFNTASSKVLLDMLYRFEDMYRKGHDVLVKWYYPDDDEDMEETGREYAEIVALPFQQISYTVVLK